MSQMKSDPVKTMLTIAVGMMLMHMVFHLQWLLHAAFVIGLIGMFSERLSLLAEKLWMKLAHVLSLIVPRILLSAIFYLLLFPVALLSRLFGKGDPLMLNRQATTTYRTVNKQFDRAHFEKTW